MNIKVDHEQARVPVAIIRLADRINLGNNEELEKKARDAYAAGDRHLLLDLTNVPSITSAGLRTIQIIYKLFELGSPAHEAGAKGEKSAHFKLVGPNAEICRVLTLVGFDAYIDICSNEQEALKTF